MNESNCPCGKSLTTADIDGLCYECRNKAKFSSMLYGWICPRCGLVHSPYSMTCGCTPPIKVWIGTTTGGTNEAEKGA